MTQERYATANRRDDRTVMIWEVDADGRHKVVERDRPLADAGDLAVWQFEVDTTDIATSQANSGIYPVLDADGSPLWPGARVEYAHHARLVHVYTGFGTIGNFDQFGGTLLRTDKPVPKQIMRDIWKDDTEHYSNTSDYQREGELVGYRVLKKQVGNEHHLGVFDTWLRLADDPRTMCILKHEPDSAPRAMAI